MRQHVRLPVSRATPSRRRVRLAKPSLARNREQKALGLRSEDPADGRGNYGSSLTAEPLVGTMSEDSNLDASPVMIVKGCNRGFLKR